MPSLCHKFLRASNQLLLLKEEFERAYNAARTSRDFALTKKLVFLFQKKLKDLNKEFLLPEEFILRGFQKIMGCCSRGPDGNRRLPHPEAWKGHCNFSRVWIDDYEIQDGYYFYRPLSDFSPTEKKLSEIGITHPIEQTRLIAQQNEQYEKISIGKIFDIGEAIQEKRDRLDDQSIENLTSKEVIEAIDDAGYRPATLIELLAYASCHWKPKKPPPHSVHTTDKEKKERCDATEIYAFGSLFSDSNDECCLPIISSDGWWQELGGDVADRTDWNRDHRFLVFRK